MTFSEALNHKKQFGDNYKIDNDKIGKVLVVPSDYNDLMEYVTDFRTIKFDDLSAKKYSKNSQFLVCSIWTDGVNVLKKELK